MFKSNFFLIGILFAFLVLAGSNCLIAQEAEQASNTAVTQEIDISELYQKSNELDESSKSLENKLKTMSDISRYTEEFQNLRGALQKQKQTFSDYNLDNIDVETLVALRGNVRIVAAGLTNIETAVVEQLKNIETNKKDWENKKDIWQQFQSQKSFDGNKTAKDIFVDAEKIIGNSIKLFDGVDASALAFKQKLSETKKEAETLTSELDVSIERLHGRLFKKSAPAMFSGKFFREFNSNTNNDFFTGIAMLENVGNDFWATNNWVFILQLVLAILIGWYFKKVNNDRIKELGLGFLHKNYIASGLFLGTLIGMLFLDSYPPIIRLIYNLILGISAAVVICGKFDTVREKTSIALIFTLFILSKVCNAINLPVPMLRLFVVFASLIGGIYFFKADYNEPKEGEDKPSLLPFRKRLLNKLLGIMFIVAFICQVSGYSALANHIFDITLKSVLVGVFAMLILGIAKGCIALVLRSDILSRHSKLISIHKEAIITRCNWFVTIVIFFLAFAGIMAIWGFFDNTWHAVSSIMSYGFSIQDTKITVGSIIWAIILFYLVICSSWTVRTVLETDYYPKKNIEPGVGISINRLIYYSFICLALAIAMCILGISFQSLTVIIGALGVGIGFGLQNIVNNFASGLILLFERSIKVGDIVVVGGTWGTVKHLGLRATVIQTFANAEMIVPNSDLVASTVNNWTMTNRRTRFSINVGVAYGTDPNKVKKILLELASAHKNVLKDPAPAVVFSEFGDSSLNFELRCWVSDINNHWSTQDDLMYEVDKKFKENNIEIPFPQRDLYIKSLPEVTVKK